MPKFSSAFSVCSLLFSLKVFASALWSLFTLLYLLFALRNASWRLVLLLKKRLINYLAVFCCFFSTLLLIRTLDWCEFEEEESGKVRDFEGSAFLDSDWTICWRSMAFCRNWWHNNIVIVVVCFVFFL